MVEFIGLLKVKVVKGINLAIRDMMSSDPYVVLRLGQQVSSSPFVPFLKSFYLLRLNLVLRLYKCRAIFTMKT